MSAKKEKYSSKAAMKRHEKSEGAKERMREYGTTAKRGAAKKAARKSSKTILSGGPSGFDFKKMARPAKKSTSPD